MEISLDMTTQPARGPRPDTELSKSEFIRSLPENTPAKEVVARAKAAGLNIAKGYVYEIRSLSRRGGRGARASAPQAPRGRADAGRGGGDVQKRLTAIVLELGIPATEALLARVKARLENAAR